MIEKNINTRFDSTDGNLSTDRNYGLDIARSIAITMVLMIHAINAVFHTTLPWFWYLSLGGVDLFFALSGFLIGRILLANPDTTRPSGIIHFWQRRWLRTIPVYIFYYLLFVLLNNLLNNPTPFNFSYLIFLQNIYKAPIYYPESWSLGVEEWSYLVIPVLIICLYRLFVTFRNKNTFHIAYLVAAAVLIIAMIITRWSVILPEGYVYGVAYRMDAIAYGLIAGYLSSRFSTITLMVARIIISGGLAVWFVAVVLVFKGQEIGKATMLYYPVCGIGTALFVFGLYYHPFRRKFTVINNYSRYSYSIYLINHSLVLVPVSTLTIHSGFAMKTITLFITIALIIFLGSLSYRYLEKPILRWRDKYLP